MSRYVVVAPADSTVVWGGVKHDGSFYLQAADLLDTQTNTVYRDGAYRVVDARKIDAQGRMKPAVTGKGGTVPFKGEMAWADGERLLRDLANAERYGR